MPATQPRQLISAMTTVMSATTAAMPAKSHSTYLRVSALRRCAKLMSCTIMSSPSTAPSATMGCAETCSAPSESSSTKLRGSRRSLRAGAAHRLGEDARRVGHLAGRVAEPEAEDALALRRCGRSSAARARARRGRSAELDERVLRGLDDHGAAHVEVAHEPLEGQPVDHRDDRVCDRGERQSKRYDEAQRKRQATPIAG